MKHLLLLLSLMCSLCLQAKDGKIKYGKYVIYEGGIEKKQPHGLGVLRLVNPKNKKETDVKISGNFKGNTVFDAQINSKHMPPIDKVGNLNIIYNGDEDKYTQIDIIISNTTITSNYIKSRIKKDISIIEIDSLFPLKLHFNLTDKTANYWDCKTILYRFYQNNSHTYRCYGYVNASYLPETSSPMLSKLQYRKEMYDKIKEIFILTGVGFEGMSSTVSIDTDPFSVIFCYLKDGTTIIDNKIYYPNNDVVEIKEDLWVGTRTFSDGTKISHNGDTENFNINYSNGNTYTGTIKEGTFYPLYADITEPKFTYITGTQITNGVTTKWINGETYEARHERLKPFLNEKLLAMVDGDEISEEEAIQKQNKENLVEAIKHRMEKGASFEGELFGNVHPTAKRSYEKYGYSAKVKYLLNNDVAGYFNIEGIKTELQKKAFTQTDEYKMTYLPKLQEDKKELLDDEFYYAIPIRTGYPESPWGDGTEIGYYKYDINSGRIEFVLRDTKNAEINKGETDFHVLLGGECLTYPRSLVSLHSYQNIMRTRTYDQKLQTCKVSETSALKVENNIKSCIMVWVYKPKKLKGNMIYCKTTHLYIVNKETQEIYCDLTKSLEASQVNFKSVANDKDKETYHKQGRTEQCKWCGGSGRTDFYNRKICTMCNGRGYKIEHWW